MYCSGAMNIGEDYLQFRSLDYFAVNQSRPSCRQIFIISLALECDYFVQIDMQKLAQLTYRNGIHFSHNSGVVRWHHLGTVIKVGFKSIIMRRVVTRSDYHSGMSFQPTHRKAELRGWPGAVENKSLSAKPGTS